MFYSDSMFIITLFFCGILPSLCWYVFFSDKVNIHNRSHNKSHVSVRRFWLTHWSDACRLFSAAATGFPDGRTLPYWYTITAKSFIICMDYFGQFVFTFVKTLRRSTCSFCDQMVAKNWDAGWPVVWQTVTGLFVLNPLLGHRGCVLKQSVCFLVSVGWLEQKCFQMTTKSCGRPQSAANCALFVAILCIYIPFLLVLFFIHRYFITFIRL